MRTPPSRPAAVRLTAALVATVVALLVPGTAAWAHNALRTAVPAQDTTLSVAPTEITLEFVEHINPAYATIVVTDTGRRRVPTSEPVIVQAKGAVRLTGPMPNGSYTVAYRVVSVDGHPAQGSYAFTVADPAGSDAPSAVAGSPATADADHGLAAGVGVAVLVIGAAAVAGLRWRRRAASR